VRNSAQTKTARIRDLKDRAHSRKQKPRRHRRRGFADPFRKRDADYLRSAWLTAVSAFVVWTVLSPAVRPPDIGVQEPPPLQAETDRTARRDSASKEYFILSSYLVLPPREKEPLYNVVTVKVLL
jgi:hypothetical protein